MISWLRTFETLLASLKVLSFVSVFAYEEVRKRWRPFVSGSRGCVGLINHHPSAPHALFLSLLGTHRV